MVNNFSQFLSDFRFSLSHDGSSEERKAYKNAIKDLTQEQRKDLIQIIKGNLDENSSKAEAIASNINTHLALQKTNPHHVTLSVRDTPRIKTWNKCIERAFGNLGQRVSSQKSFDLMNNDLKFLKNSSAYKSGLFVLRVKVVQRGLNEVPLWHLEEFSKLIKKKKNVSKLNVSFINNHFVADAGVDKGGLSSEYLNDLIQGVTAQPSLFMNGKTYKADLGKIPKMDMSSESHIKTNQKTFEDLGNVMMFCYQSKNIIGRFFQDQQFKAIFSLTPEEIDRPFEGLKVETKVKLAKNLLGNLDESAHDLNQFLGVLDLVLWKDGDARPSDQILGTAAYAILNSLPKKFLDEDELPDINSIQANYSEFIKIFSQSVFSTKSESLALFGNGPLDSLIAPLHSIAKGMKGSKNSEWNIMRSEANFASLFSNKIQGSVDRKDLVSSFITYAENKEITKKMDWLKDWLLGKNIEGVDGATDQEVQQFIKLCTGSSGMPSHKELLVSVQWDPSPFPVFHSCSYRLDISKEPSPPLSEYKEGQQNDHTRASFIEAMKYTMANTKGFQIS